MRVVGLVEAAARAIVDAAQGPHTTAPTLARGLARDDGPLGPGMLLLADGSWLSRLYAASDRRRRHPITVRVVESTLAAPGRRTSVDRYRLVTTILDLTMAPAHELATLYAGRWEIETVLLRRRRLRSLPRAVERKMSNYQLERAAHRAWRQPTMPSAEAVSVLPAALPGTSCRSP